MSTPAGIYLRRIPYPTIFIPSSVESPWTLTLPVTIKDNESEALYEDHVAAARQVSLRIFLAIHLYCASD